MRSNMFCTHGFALRTGLSCLTCGVARSLPLGQARFGQARRGYVGVLCVCTRTFSRPLVGKSFERLSLARSLGRRFGDLFCFRPDVD